MSIDYTQISNKTDSTFKLLGVKLTLTQQPEGTSSSVYGILKDLPDSNVAGTTTLYKQMEMLLSPKMKVVPKPGDWIVRGTTDDRFVVQSINSVAPGGKVLMYKVVVAI